MPSLTGSAAFHGTVTKVEEKVVSVTELSEMKNYVYIFHLYLTTTAI